MFSFLSSVTRKAALRKAGRAVSWAAPLTLAVLFAHPSDRVAVTRVLTPHGPAAKVCRVARVYWRHLGLS